jgi:hypothetical protein
VNPKGLFRPAWRLTALAILLLAYVFVLVLFRAGSTLQRQVAEIVGANQPVVRGNNERLDAHATTQPAPTQPPATA